MLRYSKTQKSLDDPSIAITPMSTLTNVVVSVRVPFIGQIDQLKTYKYPLGMYLTIKRRKNK